MSSVLIRIVDEIERATAKYGAPTSSHEGYGVLAEEVAELLDAIRANDGEAVEQESIQVAAVALRIADACREPAFRKRSGFGS